MAAVLLTTAALVAGFVSPANAATTVLKTLAVDANTFGSGVFVGGVPCAGTGLRSALEPPRIVIFPSTSPAAPSGSTAVAWGQHFNGTQSEATGWGVQTGFGSAADLGTFTLDVYDGTSGVVFVQAGNQAEHWAGKAAVAGTPGQWATIDGAAQTLSWTQYNTATDEPTGTTASGTIAQFAAAHPTFSIFFGLIGFGCDSRDFRFQNMRTGSAGSPDITQFGTLADSVQIKPSAAFITAGGAATIAGSAQYGGAASVVLNSKAANAASYVNLHRPVAATAVDDLTCDGNFVCRNQFAATVVHPLYNTIYKWTYPAGNGVDAAVSTFVMVHVQSKISPKFPASITHGKSFTITGKTTPAKPGSIVALWAQHGYTTTRLGTARVGSNGTFTIVSSVNASGTWALWLMLPNDKFNAASKSVVKSISVR